MCAKTFLRVHHKLSRDYSPVSFVKICLHIFIILDQSLNERNETKSILNHGTKTRQRCIISPTRKEIYQTRTTRDVKVWKNCILHRVKGYIIVLFEVWRSDALIIVIVATSMIKPACLHNVLNITPWNPHFVTFFQFTATWNLVI